MAHLLSCEQLIANLSPEDREHITSLGLDRFIDRGEQELAGGKTHWLQWDVIEHQRLALKFYALDRQGLFADLVGVIGSLGFSIDQGIILTLQPDHGPARGLDYLELILDEEPLDPSQATLEHHIDRVVAIGLEDPESSRSFVIEEAASFLSSTPVSQERALLPVDIEFSSNLSGLNRLSVRGQDTPFFLFALSVAMALHDTYIESVLIRTRNGFVEDKISFGDSKGRPIAQSERLERIRLSLLITKQFTFFLGSAPNPSQALSRFERILSDLNERDSLEAVIDSLTSTRYHRELARVLGTSDFLWEDFVRQQHEQILPLLDEGVEQKRFSLPIEQLYSALQIKLAQADSFEAKVEALNSFKNRQAYYMDLDHILQTETDFFFLSRSLSALADVIVQGVLQLGWEKLTAIHGLPRTAAGVRAQWAVFGLGKLGGKALGYASDLELMGVYSDSGETDGPKPLSNRDFFERFFKQSFALIHARREGIFQVDLRLRPHGIDGPIAVKLEQFLSYYGPGGQAHSAEKMALIRMRAIAGDPALGHQVQNLRDDLLYNSDAIVIDELRDLRRKQLESKVSKDLKHWGNAKFSPGALVDLEYNVQILQLIHGKTDHRVRTEGIHEALAALEANGTIHKTEAGSMVSAYRFLRSLINGLRMLRGNAKDLELPQPKDIEFRHLARRIGYQRQGKMTAGDQLKLDFLTHTARVRSFVERHLGRDAIPGEHNGTIADLVLSDAIAPDKALHILTTLGFKDLQKALSNIMNMKRFSSDPLVLSQVLLLASDLWAQLPDPDTNLNRWERIMSTQSNPGKQLNLLLTQPARIGLIQKLCVVGPFVANTLSQEPSLFRWITDEAVVRRPKDQLAMEAELRGLAENCTDRIQWLEAIRRYRKKELLRIGFRDLGLGARIEEIMGEISFLARSLAEVTLEEAWKRVVARWVGQLPPVDLSRFCILSFGKLGGWELNYSSDIDLLAIYEPHGERRSDGEERFYTALFRQWVQDLTDFTSQGQAYRVDLRLRPWGNSSNIVSTQAFALSYYEKNAALWEYQALIKLKPIAGSLDLGEQFLEKTKDYFINKMPEPQVITREIEAMRTQSMAHHLDPMEDDIEVKNGPGGLRDIEFHIQGLQMIHGPRHPEVLTGNSLRALTLLKDRGLLDLQEAETMGTYYTFLRRIEHCLQISSDQQLHSVPRQGPVLENIVWLVQGNTDQKGFIERLQETMTANRSRFLDFIRGHGESVREK